MHAVIGRVRIKPGHEEESLAMIEQRGVAMVRAFPGSRGGYWARTLDGDELVQHLIWLFDDEDGARVAETTALTLREMPDAPAEFIAVDVCEVVGQA